MKLFPKLDNVAGYALVGEILALEERLIYNSLKNTRIVLSLSRSLSFRLDHCSQAKFLQYMDEPMEAKKKKKKKKKKAKMKISMMKRKKKRILCGIFFF